MFICLLKSDFIDRCLCCILKIKFEEVCVSGNNFSYIILIILHTSYFVKLFRREMFWIISAIDTDSVLYPQLCPWKE